MDFELRKWDPSFAASLAESANDARIGRWLNEGFPYPYTLRDAEEFIGSALADELSVHAAVVCGEKVIGGIAAGRKRGALRHCAELGYWLAPEYWGKGVMTQAVRAFCGRVFSQTDIVRIQALVFSPNAASCRVLEKCGFRKEGVLCKSAFKNGQYFDTAIYALLAPEKERS